MNPVIVVGSGLAGITAIREFRKLDATTPVLLVTGDDGDFYSKPALSNAFAQGKSAEQLVVTAASALSASLNITLLARTEVKSIRTAERVVETRHGVHPYSKLVLALGADPIRLPLGGNAAHEVLSVNSLDDYRVFRHRLHAVRHVAILGGGLIGSEFANDLAGAGFAVTVIDPSPYPIAGLLPPPAGEALGTALEAQGVHGIFRRSVKNVDVATAGFLLTLDDGSQLQADLVLSAVGLRPRT
ncbi:MAG: FAD-dependent oxidoreductase, partial [Gammaproteobacteria bacterium]|nr:FAD-dependent oxidoreductase [Gammaproteobacteria bacterium]